MKHIVSFVRSIWFHSFWLDHSAWIKFKSFKFNIIAVCFICDHNLHVWIELVWRCSKFSAFIFASKSTFCTCKYSQTSQLSWMNRWNYHKHSPSSSRAVGDQTVFSPGEEVKITIWPLKLTLSIVVAIWKSS